MGAQYINYGKFDSWATTIDNRNTKLLEKLHEIQRLVNALQGDYESDAAVEIRAKITGMETRFQQYHDIVENYATFLRNTASDYRGTEQTNLLNAQEFI